MRLSRFFQMLALMAALVAASSPARAQKYDLRVKLTPGDKAQMLMVMDQKITQEMGGQKSPADQHMEMSMSSEVISADAGVYTVKVTYGRIAMSNKAVGGNMNFDSDDDTSSTINPMAGVLRAFVGAELTMQVTDRGKIVEMKGYEKVWEKMFATLDAIPEQYREPLKDAMKEQFGEKSMSEMLNRITGVLPDAPVGVGDSWARKVEVAAGFPMQVETTYTLKGKDGDAFLIESKGTISPLTNGAPTKINGTEVTYAMSGTQTGTLRFMTSKLFNESAIHQSMAGTMGMKAIDQQITIPMTMENDIQMKPAK
ncbi:hypothetical protein BH09SUM1_BH09SUM1_11170 [soil metagenome]